MKQSERDIEAGHFTATSEDAIKALTLYAVIMSSLSSEDVVAQALEECRAFKATYPLIINAAVKEPMEILAKAAEIVQRIEDGEAEEAGDEKTP